MRIVVTGYAGFIGSNLTRMLLREGDTVLGIDCHTYAARPMWVWDFLKDSDMRFVEANVDIRDYHKLAAVLEDFNPDAIYHLAAESHVCRSIEGPKDFATTNFMGTFNLIEALRRMNFKGRLVHVSTDEAFGELSPSDEPFSELTPTDPRSPYSASKAASDLMVRAYARTYGLNYVITRCTNNYGPNQHEEKLIPRAVLRLLQGQPMTLYGDGTHSRDWIFVDDHCRALMAVMHRAKRGELYCIGSGLELTNSQVIEAVERAMIMATNRLNKKWNGRLRIEFTNDRPTDDMRYAVNTDLVSTLGWKVDSSMPYFMGRLVDTICWYLEQKK